MTRVTSHHPAPREEPAGPSKDGTVQGSANGSTTVAVVGSLAEFRPNPTPFDLAALVRFLREIGPDLLCLDMTLEEWRRRDFGGLPSEYRDALLPLAYQTDIVVVPVGNGAEEGSATGRDTRAGSRVRNWIVDRLRGALTRLESGTRGPVAVDRGAHHAVAELLYHLIDYSQGVPPSAGIAAHGEGLATRIAEVARRDPGCRILAVVNARYCHRLRNELRHHPEVRLVHFSEL